MSCKKKKRPAKSLIVFVWWNCEKVKFRLEELNDKSVAGWNFSACSGQTLTLCVASNMSDCRHDVSEFSGGLRDSAADKTHCVASSCLFTVWLPVFIPVLRPPV